MKEYRNFQEEKIDEQEKSREYYDARARKRRQERLLSRKRKKIVVCAVVLLAVITIPIIVLTTSHVGHNDELKKAGTLSTADTGNNDTTDTQMQQTQNIEKNKSENATEGSGVRVDSKYFDDAVFVGDSVTMSFSMYIERQRSNGTACLGKAYVLSSGSLGYVNSFLPVGNENCVLPMYGGVQQPIGDSIAQIGAKKVYIMLGMNDVGAYDVGSIMESARKLIADIKEKSPGAKIYIESVTPMIASKEGENLNNQVIRNFNKKMKSFAEQNNYMYLDIYSVFADDKGYLKEEYCGDPGAMGIHLTMAADAAWEDYLMKHPSGEK